MRYDNVSLKHYNTFGIEAKADHLFDCTSVDELRQATREISGGRRYVLGGGSNVLFLHDFCGSIIRPLIGGIEMEESLQDGRVSVRVGAGVIWDEFVAWCVKNGLYGVENLSGIPGNVGASPVQNIGAYGAEAKDVIESVEGISTENEDLVRLSASECRFGYRDSVFKHELRDKVIITNVTYSLSRKPVFNLGYGALREAVERIGDVNVSNIRRAVIETRNGKLPDPKVQGNAGSFFKNPEVENSVAQVLKAEYTNMPTYDMPNGLVKIPAGWLIEQSGWKGRSLGPAAVHDRQALVLVNRGGATGRDILALCNAVRESVVNKFGIDLQPEVNFVE